MPDINIGQQGHTPGGVAGGALKSMPKLTRINGDDFLPLVYRNMGNNHAYPFIWAETITFSGSSYVMASGIKFHGMALAELGKVTVTPNADSYMWAVKDTGLNTITIHSSASGSQTADVMVMVGASPDISAIACRGNTGARQMLP